MYDIDLLKNDADIEEVCACLSIPVYANGRNKNIACPDHQERHHDNCRIYGNRYYCFSCGASGDAFSLVQKTFNVDFKEALRMVLSCMPDPQKYSTDETYVAKKAETRKILGDKDLEFLDIKNSKVTCLKGFSDVSTYGAELVGYDTQNQTIYAEFEPLMNNPLMELYNTDSNSYNHLIKVKARDKMKSLKALKAFILDSQLSEEFKKSIGVYIDSDISRASKLYVEHGGKIVRREKSLLSQSTACPGAFF